MAREHFSERADSDVTSKLETIHKNDLCCLFRERQACAAEEQLYPRRIPGEARRGLRLVPEYQISFTRSPEYSSIFTMRPKPAWKYGLHLFV